jgi:copper chaperone NosL
VASAAGGAAVWRALLLAALCAAGCARSEGPQPIAWDREACAHCRMLISDPRFAAQLETPEGEPRSFDDPGCLLAELASRSPRPRALWFHHALEERWLAEAQVGFLAVERTPMGYGLAAVDASAPGALSLAQAQARVAARGARPEPHP